MEMEDAVSRLIDPLLIFILFLASMVAPAFFLRKTRVATERIPRHYVEELHDYVTRRAVGRPYRAVGTLIDALESSGLLSRFRAPFWRLALTGPLAWAAPSWLHRRLVQRLLQSSAGEV
ncbi:MAG: hypothetical protein RQ798_00705 [Candidatus Caldarchaeales archaeon]|nr:hypothetical protein [Candidatus Caldarchaeales archaeon]MDT7915033.1 hypothetical protein [Candidatus Caldarchaeales archaeon]